MLQKLLVLSVVGLVSVGIWQWYEFQNRERCDAAIRGLAQLQNVTSSVARRAYAETTAVQACEGQAEKLNVIRSLTFVH